MKKRLFIQLPDDPNNALIWGQWNSDDERWDDRGEVLSVDLVALAERAQKCETIVIVPASKVTYKQVTTPAKQLKQIQAAVPYMLEDQLANPIDQLHFAYGKRNKDGKVDVFWTTHEQMEQWLEWFDQAEIAADVIVSENALLKDATDATEIILNDRFALVNEVGGECWSCQRDLLPLIWKPSSDQAAGDSEEKSLESEIDLTMIRIFHTGELESVWQEKENVIAQALTEYELLDLFCQEYSKNAVNLRQLEYVVKKQSNLQWKKYKALTYVCGFSFVTFLIYQGSSFFVLHQENKVVREQAEQKFQQVFSRRPRAGSIFGQAKRLIQRQGSGNEQGEFLKLLEQTSTQIASIDQIRPTSITYDGRKGELRLDVLAPDYQALNNFKDTLVKSGLQVDMSSASAQGDAYSTRLVIRSRS
ncbi:type II secretion system protein GspL [Pleionea sediminis]|uniref:type II secretion system protein GspL n=1 Tax=Pleionea sediminis TaxID=2569479 RepID=UPI0011867D68|nr:type II secretion system protein GspL [Pleionea sediminis]